MSDKRRAQMVELAEAREAVIARSRGACEANTPACPRQEHWGEHAHHVKRRSQGGEHTADNLKWVCAAGHRFVHDNPEWSYAHGLLVSRYGS